MIELLALTGFLGLYASLLFLNKCNKKTVALLLLCSLFVFVLSSCSTETINDINSREQPPAATENNPEEPADNNDPTGEARNDESGTADVKETDTSGQLQVHFIDVGQGDSILIRTDSKNILIDAGERGTTVVNYLKNIGIHKLDLVVGTHPHADHIGGLINVLQALEVDEVIDPAIIHTTKTFEDYLTLIDEKDITFTEGRAGLSRDLGDGAILQVLHPSSPAEDDLNNTSVVTKVTFGMISFLFTGDAETESEKEMLTKNSSLKSTILKVGHHGSRTSTSPDFLNAVDPDAAVIMAGQDNRYDHPHDETLDKLDRADVHIYRTDIHGTIVITTDSQRYEINIKEAYQHNPPKEPEPDSSSASSSPQSESEPAIPAPTTGKINLNTANLEELQEIIHIGSKRAQEILELRPFQSLDELSGINGIGAARLQDIKNEGKAFAE